MMRSAPLRSDVGLLVALFFLLLPNAAAWGDHHEREGQKDQTEEATAEKVLHLAHEIADLLERGVKVYETAEPQDMVLQQRQRDAAKGALLRAKDAAVVLVKELEGGASLSSSDAYFRTVDGNLRAALATAGDAKRSTEAASLLDRLDALVRELARIYDQKI